MIADLALRVAGARAHLETRADTARLVARTLRFEARNVNLAEILADGPRSRFDLEVRGQGGGRSASEATGNVELRVLPDAVIEGRPLGPVRARLEADRGRYRLHELLAVVPGLRISGQGESDGRKMAFDAKVHADDLKLTAGSLGLPRTLGVAGRGVITARIGGSVQRPELTARARMPVLRVADTAVDGLDLSVRTEGTRLPMPVDARLKATSVRAGGRRFGQVALTARSTRAGAFSLDASLRSPTPLALLAAGRARPRGADGLAVDLARLRLSYPQATWELADRAQVEVGGGRLEIAGLDLRAEPGQRVRADLRGRGKKIEAHLVVVGLDLARLPPGALPPGRRLGGRASVDLRTSGRLPGPEVELTASLQDGRVDRLTDLQLDLAATNRTRDGIDARLRLAQARQQLAELDAHVGATLAALVEQRGLNGTPFEVNGRVGPVRLQRLGLPTASLAGAEEGRPVFRALVQAQVAARGTLADPAVKVRVIADQARLGNKPLGAADVRLDYEDARPALEMRVDSANGGRLELALQARADLSVPGLQRGLQVRAIPVTGQLTSRALDLGILSGLNDTVRAIAGTLEGAGRIEGNVGAPQLAGKLAWKNGRLLLAGLGEYRDIDLQLRGDPREMVLEHLRATSGSGTANLSGRAVREGDGRRLAVEARAKLDKFRFYTEGQALGALSLEASVEGNVAPERIAMRVTIPESHFELAGDKRKKVQSLKRPGDIVILENGQPLDAREARKLQKLEAALGDPAEKEERRVRVRLEADRNLWVRGPDMNVEVGLDPGFVLIQEEEPRLFGTVRVRRGFVQVLGRRFYLSAGSTLTFGGRPDLPTLSVDATYTAEAAATTVNVHVEGPADRLAFTLRSPEHPEYGDTELLSLVMTGKLPDELGSGGGAAPSDRAASLLGGLLASRLQKALAKRLPLDVLLLEPGKNMEGARLEAGTYLGDDLYLAYIGRMGTDPFARENRNEVHLELQLGQRWSLEGSFGDARRGSADLIWTRTY